MALHLPLIQAARRAVCRVKVIVCGTSGSVKAPAGAGAQR